MRLTILQRKAVSGGMSLAAWHQPWALPGMFLSVLCWPSVPGWVLRQVLRPPRVLRRQVHRLIAFGSLESP